MPPSTFGWNTLWGSSVWRGPHLKLFWPPGGPLIKGPLRFASSLRGAPPVGQRQVKKLLRHGSRSRSPLLLLPPYVPIHELRVFFRLPYPSVFSLCQVRQSHQTKTLRWRDTSGRVFELVNKRNVLIDFHRAAHAAKRFGLRAIQVDAEPDWQQPQQQPQQQLQQLQQQVVPVAALLGHINHGKTTLLDRLAGTLVAPYEAGGITQQLLGVTVRYSPNSSSSNSSSNNSSSRLISFIDTPGHAAMETMRARAAAAADVAVVVIEAEKEGQQQTAEVIRQADACGLPVVFVLNKVDRLLLPSNSSDSSSSHHMSSEAVLRRLQQFEALEDEEDEASLSMQAESAPAAAAAAAPAETATAAAAAAKATEAATAGESTAEGEARRHLLLLRMQLRRECQRMHEAGEVSRDLSAEAMRALPVSALYGYGAEGLIRRLLEQTRDRGLIYTVLLKAGSLLPGNAPCINGKQANCVPHRRSSSSSSSSSNGSDALTAGWPQVQQQHQHQQYERPCLRHYFVAGSAYGRIASVSRYTCEFRGAPYTPEALREDQGAPSKSFEAGSILQVSTQRGKEGEAAVDDLLLCLPQARAFRLAQHRERLEGLTLQQIDGPLLQLPWEVDHPKEPGSRWGLQQQHQQQIRRPVSEGRRAIEEFGFPHEEGGLLTSSSSSSSSSSSLFTGATRADFERPLRSLPASSRGVTAPLDELELLRRGAPSTADGGSQIVCKKIELEPIVITPEEEGEPWVSPDAHHEEAGVEGGPPDTLKPEGWPPSLGRRRRLRARLYEERTSTETERAYGEKGIEEAPCMHSKPWGLVGSREEWAERVVRENEALMDRWRAKSKQRVRDLKEFGRKGREEGSRKKEEKKKERKKMKKPTARGSQRCTKSEMLDFCNLNKNAFTNLYVSLCTAQKEAYEEQQRLGRAAEVEAEQQRRAALQEPPLTEEEVRRYLAGEEKAEEERQREAGEGKVIPAPPKDAPVVPVILRTRYVGSFDVMLDEFEKLEAEMRMRIPVVHGGIGPVIPRDVVHAEVERTYGYCPIYAFQVPVLPDAVKQAVVSKVIIKKFDVFTDLLHDVRNRCENIRRLQDHNLYVRSLKKQPTKSGL
ncbi:hypothetical protein Emag_004617 [Eimeria magna]